MSIGKCVEDLRLWLTNLLEKHICNGVIISCLLWFVVKSLFKSFVAWLFTIILSCCTVVLVLSLRRCDVECMTVCERVLYL